MKVERNILSKKNLAELENLVNRLDDAVVGARLGIFERGHQRAMEGDYTLNRKQMEATKYTICQRDVDGAFIIIEKFW